MFRKSWLLFAMSFFLIFSGCTSPQGASAGKIIAPVRQESPLTGKWLVVQDFDANGSTGETEHQWQGNKVQFAKDAVKFGGYVWNDLSYKIKRVAIADYLLTKYIALSDLDIPETQTVDVITIYSSTNYIGEFMEIDDTSMIAFVQNQSLLLQKVADQADSTLSAANSDIQGPIQAGNEGTSGVLLGLRIPTDSGYTYRTLWIAVDNLKLHPVLMSDQIFFPRTSGYWELNVEDITEGDKTGNILTASNVAAKALEKQETEEVTVTGDDGSEYQEDIDLIEGPDLALRIIDYIGNDYVAIEKESEGINCLQVLPVDKLSSPTGISIFDLLGANGADAYMSTREDMTASLKQRGISLIYRDEFGENFGLIRKNGHWLLMGRINYQNDGIFSYMDFALKTVPPSNLIFYDTLVLNWHTIKDRVPDAIDAFTSPNKDIALVKTKNKLMIYAIGSAQLGQKPLAELDLENGETVIMAEWATGSYVNSWEKSFSSYGAQALSDSDVRMR